ncbi:hypothetical protein [Antarctobacter sp.]|uniref:hypothetical protein n=1 Tax=Antarctobacter sp. TaxID=1872577 RepID=UPI003A91368A
MSKRKPAKPNRSRLPNLETVAAFAVVNETVVFVKKNILSNQIRRDGPKVAKSFDRLTKTEIAECSEVFARVQATLLGAIGSSKPESFESTFGRLMASALNSYLAAIEVARHGLKRQFGANARMAVEAAATALSVATEPTALDKFHDGKLSSTKCITYGKRSFPLIGELYGFLSNEFVHIGTAHSMLEFPSEYQRDDVALGLLVSMMKTLILVLEVVADLAKVHLGGQSKYWFRNGEGWSFDPSDETREWIGEFCQLEKLQRA